MASFDIFSKRQKKLRGDVPDIYIYDTIPQPLKVQVVHIWRDILGDERDYQGHYAEVFQAYKFIVGALCREYGLFFLPPEINKYNDRRYIDEIFNFLIQQDDSEKVLDAIEFSFRVIDKFTRRYEYLGRSKASELADSAIEELNQRFQEHGIGFQYLEGEIIRIDSQLIHLEVVKPALGLIRAPEFAGAQAEFLKAHEHYRHGNDKETLAECLKAFESVMKIICKKRGWAHDANATSKALLDVLFVNEVIPKFWQQHFNSLRSSLETGIPPARNRLGGHGQGSDVTEVPPAIVAYVLHMTASAIVFLCEMAG
ncbi:hypothetical protein A1359_08545 [Methylomonas lenta]|uniref:Abortive infection protein-like C-terminal domain-containing protein n=1 Tax=Methylomonas lenta TaxID=980561 RepID=A0A177NE88_9GAMM|nr:hypothetical protein [Methylomonas lenta]OAI16378.1 hypothetical protein A1359_08545 [Methylomonas lenta]